MIQNKSNFIFAAILSLAIFSTVIYFSCQKTGNALACDGVVCHNGGSCLKGQCMCPAGYEDSSCSTTVVTKYLGVWNVLQTIRRSDTASRIGKDTMYQVTFEPTTNNSSFFIYNFLGNSEYNQVLCSISQTNSYSFVIDTATNAIMRFDHIHFWSGTGTIYLAFYNGGGRNTQADSIKSGFVYEFINKYGNWQSDSLSWLLTRP